MLSSCDLILPHDTNKGYGKIVLVDVSLNYDKIVYPVRNLNTQRVEEYGLTLEGPLNDAADVAHSFSALASKNNTPLYIIPMNQKTLEETSEGIGDGIHDSIINDALSPTKKHVKNLLRNLEKLDNVSNSTDISQYCYVVGDASEDLDDFPLDLTPVGTDTPITVTDDDLVIFYYSGHGTDDGSLCLCQEFVSVTEHYRYSYRDNFLKCSDLLNCISSIPGKKFIILDSCFSGVAVDEDTYTTNTQNDEYDGSSIWDKLFSSATATQYDDVYVMTATNSTHRAGDDTDISPAHGCLTRSMDEAIGWDWKTFTGLADDIPANDGGDITVDSLYASTSAKFDSCYAEYYGLDNYLVVNGGREDLLLFTGL
jgi:hypothetical protein